MACNHVICSTSSVDLGPSTSHTPSIFKQLNESNSESSGEMFRRGRLLDCVETPTFSLYSQCGILDYILPNALRQIAPTKIITLPYGEVANMAKRGVGIGENHLINSFSSNYEQKIEQDSNGEAASFHFDHNNYILHLNFRNSGDYDKSIFGGSTIQVATRSGRVSVNPERYLSNLRKLNPHIFTCPSEECPAHMEIGRRKLKRVIGNCMDFHKALLDSVNREIETHSTLENRNQSDQQSNGNKIPHSPTLLASIPAIRDDKLREKVVSDIILLDKYNSISGFYIGGFGYGESSNLRGVLLYKTIGLLPKNYPRFTQLSQCTVVEILHAVYLGIDVIEYPSVLSLAERGIAYTFSVGKDGEYLSHQYVDENDSFQTEFEQFLSHSGRISELDAIQIDLKSNEYFNDYSKVSDDSNLIESRAYINHLLTCEEILGVTLVTSHNLYLLEKLFEEVRINIQRETFLEFLRWFLKNQCRCYSP